MDNKKPNTKNRKVCDVLGRDVSPCERELFDNEHCIFHSKDIERKKAGFNEIFWKEFDRQESEEKQFDFSGFIFPSSIDFSGRKFYMNLDFCEAEFFGDKTSFSKAEFLGDDAIFIRVNFSSNETDFSGAIFKGIETLFLDSKFSGLETYFSAADFLAEDTCFYGVEFSSAATYFSGTEFSSKLLSFEKSYFENVIGLFDFGVLQYYGKCMKKVIYKINDFKFILGRKSEARYPLIARKTKDAYYLNVFKEQHQFIYKIWNLTAKCGQSLFRWAFISFLIAMLFGAIYADYSCPSWLEWINVGNWLENVNPEMAIDQPNIGQEVGQGIIPRAKTAFTPYYFSLVTFTTLGFGDVTPVNLPGEIWLAIEVVLGYLMLGGLISIFAVKLARRS